MVKSQFIKIKYYIYISNMKGHKHIKYIIKDLKAERSSNAIIV